ncbi:uncharacterized protein LOC103580926 [Microplitis demolitor]|uniref:uncharacterized protein LOC103580926 n=1 Tax=Microplitis demolitor TaxID=69319 RepID=UPI0004CC9473|nr:uncharacterized protein LOC103580926 [Microplitis demolitor]XP_008561086.1 uncharacterized protein LOC103580926 [Microplitis demolitor]
MDCKILKLEADNKMTENNSIEKNSSATNYRSIDIEDEILLRNATERLRKNRMLPQRDSQRIEKEEIPLLYGEFDLLTPGRELLLSEQRRELYRRLAELYEAIRKEDEEDKRKKREQALKN